MSNPVTDALNKFFNKSDRPLVFTGAGVSGRAGLPTWKDLITKLAEGLRSTDSMTTQQMLDYANSGDYTQAFEYFKISKKMVEGDKQKLIVALLSTFDPKPLIPLSKLPFGGCLTTNFDRSILEAIAIGRGQAARDYRLGDASLKQAVWESNLFVARIHGFIESPESIVLSDSQFQSLLTSETYTDLLADSFLRKNVLFLGFSFYDPAVRFIFETINSRFGPAAPGRHMAIVPDNLQSEFFQKANRLNIELIRYDQSNNHSIFWNGIDDFLNKSSEPSVLAERPQTSPFESTKRFLAACYARARTVGSSIALRTSVVEGVISAMLQEVSPSAMSRDQLLEKIRLTLGIKGRDAEHLLDEAIKSLVSADLCRKLKGVGGRLSNIAWIGSIAETDSLEFAIRTLTKSAMNRALLQEGWETPPRVNDAISSFFEKLIRRRGWDLGAAFAAGRAPETVAVEDLLDDCAKGLAAYDKERLSRVLQTMFQLPSEEESRVLGELGRISFALELAFQSPHSVLLHNAILPRKIYFDASVLLPALIVGHPFNPVYSQAIRRLKEAATSATIDLTFNVCTVYLNEIISHREKALEFSKQAGESFPEIAQSDALYHGLTNVNVFVGAYANWIHTNERISFNLFLERFAPYSTEIHLKKWLSDKGFKVVDSLKGSSYPEVYSLLEMAYAEPLSRGKGSILIEHDATQISILVGEKKRAEKAIFVTADKKLQQAVANSRFSLIADVMMSHVGLVQFIELLLGGISDGAALTQLLWSARVSEQAQAVRSYFTTRGLERYDDGMAMAMPQIIEQYAETAAGELQRVGADLESESPEKRVAAFRMLGSLEKNYLAGMSEAVAKLRKD